MDKNNEEFMKCCKSFYVQDLSLPCTITDNYDLYYCLHKTDEKSVYLIHSKETGELSILKTCSDACKEDIAQEYKLLKSLDHASVAKAHSFFEQNGHKYLIREYFEGQTLSQIVAENGPFDAKEAIRIVVQLCDVVQSLHTHKPPIIHRDIKPQNVIYSTNNKCRLIDFGIARLYRNDNQKDTICLGTQDTAAPEQYGYRQTSNKSDIYSIGILLLYLLTGSFDIDRKVSIKNKRLTKIINKCVRFDPKNRYASVQHLSRSLKAALLCGNRVFQVALASGLSAMAIILAIGGFSFYSGGHYKSDSANTNQPEIQPINMTSIITSTETPKQTSEFESTAEAEQTAPPLQHSGSVMFSSPLVEEAVRRELGFSKTKLITQADLDKVTKILICGTTVYDNWEDNSINTSAYFVNGNLCNDYGTITSLDDISKMRNLSELALFNQQIDDLSSLKGLNLTKLGIGGNAISDISELSAFTNLKELYLGDNPIRDITPLSQLTGLTVLDIGNTYVKDISLISNMSLQKLCLIGSPVQDYSPLAKLNHIAELSLSDLAPKDIDICTSLTSLQKLWVYSSHVTDIKTFSRLRNLISIDVFDNDIQSLQGIDRFMHLNTLCIERNPITDLTPIKDTNIVTMNIADIPVTDYKPLSDLKNLSLLFCKESQKAAIEEACDDKNVQIILK